MKAIAKYPGSKWSLADWIIGFFPEHHSYLEPFFGSGAVLFNKSRSNIETVNDLDGNVVNLFECIRRDPEKIAHYVYWIPYSREVYDQACMEIPKDKFEAAAVFLIRLNMGYGFRTNGIKSGWKNDIQGRERAYAAKNWVDLPDLIVQAAERIRGVQIENRPAVEVIKRFNHSNVLIYCDPPYMLNTRQGKKKQYRYEMDDKDHEELLGTLLQHKGYVIISGYDTDLYNSMLNGWEKRETTAYSQVCSKKREVIWMNYEPPVKQLSLFENYGGLG